ncbi:hypothetical protein RND81_08G189100 [Saponaria officinalis]|uniref:RING-type E3 ubiquitin transferase n=1 Tax=Saponaria officinalis TaxID=3572 RepID=A0AAW1J9X4_SAPOF
MDEYSSRRSSGGVVLSRRGPSLLKNSIENNRDRNGQVCSRAGCSSRLNNTKDVHTGSPSKAKTPRTSFGISHGKEVAGSSSRSPTSLNTSKKSFSGLKKKIPFSLDTNSETSSTRDDSEEVSDSTRNSGKTLIRVHPEPNGSGPTNRPVKRKPQRLAVGKQDSGTGFSGSLSFKQTNQASRTSDSTSRYNLRNLKCNSISDVVPSGCSSPSTGRKRIGEPESSSTARGKKTSGPTLNDRKNDNFSRGVSISDSRPTRNSTPAANNDATSVRNRRSTFRTRVSNQETRIRLPLVESRALTPSSPELDTSVDANDSSSDDQISAQIPSYRSNSYNVPGSSSSSNDHERPSRLNGPYDGRISRSFMNRDALRQYGIAEMLLALDRIEQDEEPNYEQLLVLETNLFLGGLTFHDQHRDMRLDIDNMSYEELLALGDRMGTVSTAVPEDVLTKCVKRNVFHGTTDCRENEDDIKCSICQEEYADGDEMGRLECEHRYHIDCVNQWLRLKNWCPVCKASATPSPSPS